MSAFQWNVTYDVKLNGRSYFVQRLYGCWFVNIPGKDATQLTIPTRAKPSDKLLNSCTFIPASEVRQSLYFGEFKAGKGHRTPYVIASIYGPTSHLSAVEVFTVHMFLSCQMQAFANYGDFTYANDSWEFVNRSDSLLDGYDFTGKFESESCWTEIKNDPVANDVESWELV